MTHNPFPDAPDPGAYKLGTGFGRAARDAQGAYERSAVARVCTLLGAPSLAREVALLAEERDAAGVSFALFDEISGFPIRFRVGRLRKTRFIALPDLFDRFAKTPIGWGLADIAEDVDPADGPIGLIFNWPGLPDDSGRSHAIKGGKFMTAHTYDRVESDLNATQIIKPMQLRGARVVVTVETLESLLQQFRGWQR